MQTLIENPKIFELRAKKSTVSSTTTTPTLKGKNGVQFSSPSNSHKRNGSITSPTAKLNLMSFFPRTQSPDDPLAVSRNRSSSPPFLLNEDSLVEININRDLKYPDSEGEHDYFASTTKAPPNSLKAQEFILQTPRTQRDAGNRVSGGRVSQGACIIS